MPTAARSTLPRRARRWRAAGRRLGPVAVHRAEGFGARLLGLAWLRRPPPGVGLWLRGTHSVHTLGMRFALDLVWLDAESRVVRVDRGVGPARLRSCRAAKGGVVEVPAGAIPALLGPGSPN